MHGAPLGQVAIENAFFVAQRVQALAFVLGLLSKRLTVLLGVMQACQRGVAGLAGAVTSGVERLLPGIRRGVFAEQPRELRGAGITCFAQGRQTFRQLGQFLIQPGALGIELGERQFALAQCFIEGFEFAFGLAQGVQEVRVLLARGVGILALTDQPVIACRRLDGGQFGAEGVRVEGPVRRLPSLIGVGEILTLLRQRGFQRAIVAEQFVALLLGIVQCLLGLGELAFFFRLLGRELGGFRAGRRRVAPGVVESATDRAGLTVLQVLAEPGHAFAAHRAVAFDHLAHRAVMAIAVVTTLTCGLPLGQQGLTALGIRVEAFGERAMGVIGTLDILPTAVQLAQRQVTLGGLIMCLLSGLAGIRHAGVVTHRLAQGGLPVVALLALALLRLAGLAVPRGQCFRLTVALGVALFQFRELLLLGGELLGLLARLA